MKPEIIAQAAEAIIYKEGNKIIKDRIKKSYRIPEIDNKIRKLRTRSEAKLLEKAGKIINTPTPLKKEGINNKNDFQIIMPFIDGKKISDNLDSFPIKKQKQILNQIGQDVAKLHNADIIHGDLTTSNMIFVEADSLASQKNKKDVNKKRGDKFNCDKKISSNINLTDKSLILINKKSNEQLNKIGLVDNKFGGVGGEAQKIFFIDFGLGYISKKIEDKAVDIHLLKQALEAKHFRNWEVLFKEFEKGYSKNYSEFKIILKRLKVVEKRGRYKH